MGPRGEAGFSCPAIGIRSEGVFPREIKHISQKKEEEKGGRMRKKIS